MKFSVTALAAVAALGLAAGSASAQYVVVPHRGHYHTVPTYSTPVYGGYSTPVYNSGVSFGANYYSPGVSLGVTYGSPVYGGGFVQPAFGVHNHGGYAQPAFGGFAQPSYYGGFGGYSGGGWGGHHHHHHHCSGRTRPARRRSPGDRRRFRFR